MSRARWSGMKSTLQVELACHQLRTKRGDKLRYVLLGDFNAKLGPRLVGRFCSFEPRQKSFVYQWAAHDIIQDRWTAEVRQRQDKSRGLEITKPSRRTTWRKLRNPRAHLTTIFPIIEVQELGGSAEQPMEGTSCLRRQQCEDRHGTVGALPKDRRRSLNNVRMPCTARRVIYHPWCPALIGIMVEAKNPDSFFLRT